MRKNSILVLSLIAIAVLITAIISGSYAYFKVVGDNTSATTQINGETPNIGTVGTTGGLTLNMNLSASNMSIANQGTTYYAQTGEEALSTKEVNHNIATMTVVGGSEGLTYTCSGQVTISLPEDSSANTIKNALTAGNLFVKLTQGDGLELTDSGEEIDLFTAQAKDITKDFTYTLNDDTKSTNIIGDVYFKNINDNQNALANKTIKVDITVTTTECNVANAE